MKFFEKDPLEETFMRLAENELYEVVAKEVLNEIFMAGIWGRAFSDTEGNAEKAKALYINYRVQDLKDRCLMELSSSNNNNSRDNNNSGQRNVDYRNDDLARLTKEQEDEEIYLINDILNIKI